MSQVQLNDGTENHKRGGLNERRKTQADSGSESICEKAESIVLRKVVLFFDVVAKFGNPKLADSIQACTKLSVPLTVNNNNCYLGAERI